MTALKRDFQETIKARAQRGRAFRKALLVEADRCSPSAPGTGALSGQSGPGRAKGARNILPAAVRCPSRTLSLPGYNPSVAWLDEYVRKRRFEQTPEPRGGRSAVEGHRFVVQKHDATRLHYDFRLEIDGVLKSWAVPKGPSLNPADKRLAVQTEDHPIEYGDFEGSIPQGNYGAGTVMVWDAGTFEVEPLARGPAAGEAPATKQIERGELKFSLRGQKLRGSFALVKLKRSAKGNEWLLLKHNDAASDPNWSIDDHDGSVLTGRSLDEIAENAPPYFKHSWSEAGASGGPAAARAGALEGARKAPLPDRVTPTLATLAARPFSNPDWLFEIKLDGVRALARISGGRVELRSRAGRVIDAQYPELAGLAERVDATEAILDGEIVVLDERGRSDFERLQSRMNVAKPPPALVRQSPVLYYLFDLVYVDGYDLRDSPLVERKRLLREIVRWAGPFRYCDHQPGKGRELFELAREQGLEGVIGKHARSPYTSARTPYWLKFKATRELDAVVAGWTEGRGSREYFGALLLGLYNAAGELEFIGSVGTGFDEKGQRRILERLHPMATERSPFKTPPATREKAFWTQPKLVANVRYANWTEQKRLRAPVFLGLRGDVEPGECQFETESPQSAPHPSPALISAPALAGRVLRGAEVEQELFHGRAENAVVEIDGRALRLSNLNKVYFPESGITKRQLLAYYYRMAGRVLPFIEERPLVLRRYPDGITSEAFFQKDAAAGTPEWMPTVELESEGKRKSIRYLMANDRAALIYLTNLGCIDQNPWSSRVGDLEHPDYVFFDLDPSEGTEFTAVVEVARAVLARLQALSLEVFLKTSGATGFHLWLPLEPVYTYEQVRAFAEIIGRLVAAEMPKLVTQERTVEKRPAGTVLIDASQNARGRPLAAPYTVRAFPHAPVSTPVRVRELRAALRPERLNLKTVEPRLARLGDLWSDFWAKRQRLENALGKLMATESRRNRRRVKGPQARIGGPS